MRQGSRALLRAGIVAGLALTAIPLTPFSASKLGGSPASAARLEVPGLSAALIARAATQPVSVILMARPGVSTAELLRTLRATGATKITPLEIINGVAATVSGGSLDALRGDPSLRAVSIDRLHRIEPLPAGQDLAAQIARASLDAGVTVPAGVEVLREPDTLQIIHADQVQKQFTGRGVRVALIDSGVDMKHPDLAGIMLRDGAGRPLYQDFTGTDLTDTVGHGTNCAGVIAAQAKTVYSVTDTYRTNVYPPADPSKRFTDRTYFTVGGVAPGIGLMAAKIFDTRNNYAASDSNIVMAIQWAISNHADVLSESFGTPINVPNDGTDAVSLADEAAVRAGITVVASNGNDGSGQGTTGSPANAPGVIAVGASNGYRLYGEVGQFANLGAVKSDNMAGFSSRGPTSDGRIRPDVSAPGDAAWSTSPLAGSEEWFAGARFGQPRPIDQFGGTSQAAPVVTGAVALVIQAYRETHGNQRPAPAYVKQVLSSSADDLGYPVTEQGAGRINALRAVQAVTHQGPAVLLSPAPALRGLPGQPLTADLTVSNSGNTAQQISLQPQTLHQQGVISFGGKVVADQPYVFKFDVPGGVSKLTAAINWDTLRSVPFPGQAAGKAMLRVQIYDPAGNFVNYDYDVQGSGFVGATAGNPVAGRWTAVVWQRPRRDKNEVRHLVNVPFSGRVVFAAFRNDGGTVSPASLTLKPGQKAVVRYTAPAGRGPGVSTVSLHVRERNIGATDAATATVKTALPIAITTDVPFSHKLGSFSGSFGGGGAQQSHFFERAFYSFTVPANTRSLAVSVRWPHKGNLFLLSLVDPNGKVDNLVDNALSSSSDPTAPADLSTQRALDLFANNPLPGRWQVAVLSYVFAGTYASEPFAGTISLDRTLVQADRQEIGVAAGGKSAAFTLRVHNLGQGIQGYFSYPTTDQYTYLPLGGAGGALQNGKLSITGTQAITYTTAAVPPGTKQIITQAQPLNGSQKLNIQLSDPVFNTYGALGLPRPVALTGQTARGSVAMVQGKDLPIGSWGVILTLQSRSAAPVFIASTTHAYALAPNPWIDLDGQVGSDLQIQQGKKIVVALPGGTATLHGTVSVPEDTAPGSYPAKVYIYNYTGAKIAEVPLTIRVGSVAPQAFPTPDPLLAAIVATQYYPEGVSVSGITNQVDLVNPGDQPAHAQIKLLTPNGWTTINRYALAPHSRRSIDVKPLVGKNQGIAAVVQGDQPIASGRLIALTGADSSYSVGAAAPSRIWHFADGYTVKNFALSLEIANPNADPAHVQIHFVTDQGDTRNVSFTVEGSSRSGVDVGKVLPDKAVSATVRSDIPVVAERTQEFGTDGQGLTTSIGATAGLTAGYIDPGHLPGGTQAHLSLLNTASQPAKVVVTLIDQHAKPVRNVALSLKAGARATLNLSDRFGTANLGATFSSDAPIVAEKVAYFGQFRRSRIGGSALLATADPVARMVFPGGSTAGGAGEYLSLRNPGAAAIAVRVTLIYGGDRTLRRTINVAPQNRTTINVADLGAPAGSSSLIVEGVDGAKFSATQTLINAGQTDGSEITGVALQ